MNRHQIEGRDKDLIKKIRTIVKEKNNAKKSSWRLPALFLILAIAGFLAYMHPDGKAQRPVIQEENLDITSQNETASLQEVAAGQHPPRQETENPVRSLASRDSGENRTALQRATAVARMPLKPEPESAPNPDIQIARIETCKTVEKRQFVSPQQIFSLQDDSTPVVWMDVRSKKTPYTLRHVYYRNGNKYCEVPLKIKFPRMRTWSYVTLKDQNQAHMGRWRVEVITDGSEKLSQIEFEVIP